MKTQTFRGKKNPAVELLVVPGQKDRRLSTWPMLLSRLAQGKELGVILCCAYGYHSITGSYKSLLMKADESRANFLARYLEAGREEEIGILETIAGSAANNPKSSWLLTLVGKEDLWCDQEDAVRAFYTSGRYGKAIERLFGNTGNQGSVLTLQRYCYYILSGLLIEQGFPGGQG